VDQECTFDACGGDPVGTWTMAGTCIEVEGNPFGDFCTDPDLSFEMSIDASGTVTINGDQSYALDLTMDMRQDLYIPGACLKGLPSCESMDNEDEDGSMACTGDPSVGCTCVFALSTTDTETGSWSASGGTLTFDEASDGDEPDDLDFCVDGDTLLVGGPSDDIGYFSYELTR